MNLDRSTALDVRHVRRPRHRSLDEDADDFQRHFVDADGTEYDPDSLAWRYLGVYMDCDAAKAQRQAEEGYRSNGNDDGSEGCRRQLLWAAYVDPLYEGNSLDEYALYNPATGRHDNSTCQASWQGRCAKMDCHEVDTEWKLLGIFKETGGLGEFTRQLFMHQGSCMRTGADGGNQTEVWRDEWPMSDMCSQLDNPDIYGSDIYMGVRPLPGGNMTLAIYTDPRCTMPSAETDLTNYMMDHYYALYRDLGMGLEIATAYNATIDAWNERMEAFKVCQPCRAYDLFSDYRYTDDGYEGQGDDGHEGQDDDGNEGQDRRLESGSGSGSESEDNMDDQDDDKSASGDRYDCVDDAGYTNVNQCLNFGLQTSLEVATRKDLARASSQGTILPIRAHWRTYGGSPLPMSAVILSICITVSAAFGLAMLALLIRKRQGAWSTSLRESLTGNGDDDDSEKGVDAANSTCSTSDEHSAISAEEAIEITILSTNTNSNAKEDTSPDCDCSEPAGRKHTEMVDRRSASSKNAKKHQSTSGWSEMETKRLQLLQMLGQATEITRVQGSG